MLERFRTPEPELTEEDAAAALARIDRLSEAPVHTDTPFEIERTAQIERERVLEEEQARLDELEAEWQSGEFA